jgi:multidrug efflux pump
MKEISFAVIVMTITLAAVYLPVAFQTDESAVMFREFAWTLAGSVLISGFVALTLTPALCGKYLKHSDELLIWQRLNARYADSLTKALQYPKTICGLLVVVLLLGVWGHQRLPAELLPIEDDDMLIGEINVENSVSDAVRESWLRDIEKLIEKLPEKQLIFSGIWQDTYAFWQVLLKPRSDRSRGAEEIVKSLQPELKKIVGPVVNVKMGEGGLGGDESLKIIIQYAADEAQLVAVTNAIIEEAQKNPGFVHLNSEQAWEKARIHVIVDRELADELGVSLDTIEDTLYTYLSGRKAANYQFQGLDYDVLVRANAQLRGDWEGLNTFFVQGGEGQWVPLGSLITLKEVLEPNQIKHYERMRGAAITVTLKPDMHLDKAIKILEPIIQKHLPREALYKFGGKAEKYKEAQSSLWLTFALALVFIYLVLAALFESFVHPFIVLLTVPLSITGAVWAINFMGGTNNVYTSIGLITLIGLITKHGILIVDFSNRLRETGMPLMTAVVEASRARLRPVLMTTLAMIFGAIPLVFGVTEGALARRHIGWVIIGGMITGTIFSLYVVPVVYSLIARKSREVVQSI